MIPETREVRLRPKIRKVLEARCRAPSTPQGDLKRAQSVAGGRRPQHTFDRQGSRRSAAHCQQMAADHGLAGLNYRPRASKKRHSHGPRRGSISSGSKIAVSPSCDQVQSRTASRPGERRYAGDPSKGLRLVALEPDDRCLTDSVVYPHISDFAGPCIKVRLL